MIDKILFVTTEAVPYIKTGGLADVTGTLPIKLAERGYEVSVVLPLYSHIIRRYMGDLTLEFDFYLFENIYDEYVRVFSHELHGVKFYFIENRGYFERSSLYGYDDDGERFAFFAHSVYKMILSSGNYPDLIHSHDWHTGMMAAIARIYYFQNYRISGIKQVFTIHNLAYQGNFAPDMLESCLGIPMSYFNNGTLRFHDGISFMKSGIVFSDKINTVSHTYAKEILTPEYGRNMQEVLRHREWDLYGIVNGIDVDLYNPETDPMIIQNYGFRTIDKKIENKKHLQKSLGLNLDENVCVLGMVTRLTWQKGIDLVLQKMEAIMGLGVQLVVLGTGDSSLEHHLRNCEHAYKGRMVYYGAYSEKTARKIFSGSDLFLMPSLFEPCGISQQIAMRYGTLPVVRETGGLKDTVQPYNKYEKTGDGFSFYGFDPDDFFSVLKFAVDTYNWDKDGFKLLQKNAMKKDLSWDRSADLYIDMYNSI